MPIPLTVVLNMQSIPFPAITNRIRVDVATQDNPLVIVATKTESAPHPSRIWSFPGLPRTNYVVTMNEIDSFDVPINNLAYFDVVPDAITGGLVRDDEQLIGGVTPGFDVGLNVVFFDGRVIDGSTNGSDFELHNLDTTPPVTAEFTFEGTAIFGDTISVSYTINGTPKSVSQDYTDGTWDNEDFIKQLRLKMIAGGGFFLCTMLLATEGSDTFWGIHAEATDSLTGFTVTVTHVGGIAGTMPDYRGWNINPERRNGGGTMQRDLEYSWNTDTGEFRWLITGDGILDGELYNIDFDPQVSTAGGSVPPSTNSFSTRLITDSDNIVLNDFGNDIIVEPSGDYLELTLPDITTIPVGLPVTISVYKAAICCVKIVGSVSFQFGTSIFMVSGESIQIYSFMRGITPEYRYRNPCGNFDKVGKIIYLDQIPANIYNAVSLGGVAVNIQKYARLWQYVQSLPPSQRVSFASWTTQQTFFSDVSGSNFMIPNRQSLYARSATGLESVGSRLRCQIEAHKHISTNGTNSVAPAPFGRTAQYGKLGWGDHDNDNDWWFTNDGSELAGSLQMNPSGAIGSETRPNSFLINQYVLI